MKVLVVANEMIILYVYQVDLADACGVDLIVSEHLEELVSLTYQILDLLHFGKR